MLATKRINDTEAADGRYRVEAVLTTGAEPLVVGYADDSAEIRRIMAWVREAPEVVEITVFDTVDGRRLTRL